MNTQVNNMDVAKENEYIFNFKLSKLLGLYQILNPDTVRVFGHNAYHIVIVFVCMYLIAISMMQCPICLYYLVNDIFAFVFYLGCVQNYVFSCYKIMNILYYANDIWKVTDTASVKFLSYRHYDKRIFNNWQSWSVRVTNIYVSLSVISLLFWLIISRALSKNMVTMKNLDGSLSVYRMNIFNLYLLASDETYNRYFNVFYIIESSIGVAFFYFSMMFDVLMVMMCFSLSCQLETICDAIKSLGHRCSNKDVLNICKEIKSKPRLDFFDDLKVIINDHQNVMKKMNDYYTIFRSVMLTQIFVASCSHVFIWFIGTLGLFEGEIGESVLSIKLFFILPMFTFQLLMTCSLFGTINLKKDSIIYALYCSNWTEMDMKSKKLILYTMSMNNGNQLKLKLTVTKVINLEMFTDTIRLCYSIFSMLVNYKKNKIN